MYVMTGRAAASSIVLWNTEAKLFPVSSIEDHSSVEQKYRVILLLAGLTAQAQPVL